MPQAMEREYKAVADEEKGEVISLGGLHVIGTERHEARRIDNQLRGRSGRCSLHTCPRIEHLHLRQLLASSTHLQQTKHL